MAGEAPNRSGANELESAARGLTKILPEGSMSIMHAWIVSLWSSIPTKTVKK